MLGEANLTPEARARANIDRMLVAAGWSVQNANAANLSAARGVAVREFVLKPPHGRADYQLFVEGIPVGAIEAKPEGTPLTGVEWQMAFAGRLVPQDPTDEPASLLLERIAAQRVQLQSSRPPRRPRAGVRR